MANTPNLGIPLYDYGDLSELSGQLNAISDTVDGAVGAASGLASLNGSGEVPATQLPPLIGSLADAGTQAAVLAALGIARGNSSVNFEGSHYSAATTINHGLDGTPTFVGFGSGGFGPGALQIGFVLDGEPTSTSFAVIGWCVEEALTDPGFNFSWVAIL
jgi:hypothetical protein